MRVPRSTTSAATTLTVTALLLCSCGSTTTNYNTDLGSLAKAVEMANPGHFVYARCAGEVSYEQQKRLKAQIHVKKPEYRYYCKGETTGPGGTPKIVTKVIRVSPNGELWHENTEEDAEAERQ
jgi:hypothetical protein